MKSVIVIGDGMSDRPIDRLGGKTPLQVARKPHIDRIAREGRTGLFRTVGETGPAIIACSISRPLTPNTLLATLANLMLASSRTFWMRLATLALAWINCRR